MQRILMSLGFRPEQTYEKWRETLVVDQTYFCLDTLPFGDFSRSKAPKKPLPISARASGLTGTGAFY